AVATKADYITVLIGANDLCAASAAAMASTADFARHIDAALGALDEGLPQSRVFLGSIPALYQLWSALHTDPKARRAWQAAGTCRSMLDPGSTEAQRGQVVARQQAFNRILAQTCARYATCRWDGGAISGYRFSAADISTLDYFHPGVRGQAELADLAWRAFEP
ncbi:SGNH/GDSL hydrolase family protein, partial [Arthrobacter deserti]|nr:SGNH/GDSL hydrolase family protein [Arthrobacter deserti]